MKRINVTKTFLPEIEDYKKTLLRAWKNNWITNRGELVLELENKLNSFLGVKNTLLLANGTIPLQIALKLIGQSGEVITTPFSYVATTSSIIWENHNPIFVDIDKKMLTIDETKIEERITKKTRAILATHVYGNPCNIEVIEQIAKKYGLYVIYDAAHCFGVKYKGHSIFSYGDFSSCSFHATKVFHTGEGGAIFCNRRGLVKKTFYSHNFGHDGPLFFHGLGINGKMSELQAALGLEVIGHMNDILERRKNVIRQYNASLNFEDLEKLCLRESTEWNFSYYPVFFSSEKQLIKTEKILNNNNIFPRRYFYPSLNKLPYINDNYNMPIAEQISRTVLCLPLYPELSSEDIDRIVKLINGSF